MKANYEQAGAIAALLEQAQQIVVVQADNPDADSLGSALAMEQILGDLGKDPSLYCGADIPTYLRYMAGWDRVSKDLPKQFDLSIVVDASTITLFERLSKSGQQGWLAAKPCVVLDHHQTVENLIPFAKVTINDHQRASTGELIYLLAHQLEWPLSLQAQAFLMWSILGDTQGLSNQLASPDTYRFMADMIEAGVNRSQLEEERRELAKMPPDIFKYKAALIKRTEFYADKIACVSVPQSEINQFSPLYNPAPLIQGDMLQTGGIAVAIVFKQYDDGRVTAAIRCNPTAGIAAELAEHFGGGGHAFASGFKVTGGQSFDQIKNNCLAYARELLAKLEQENPNAAVQHPTQKS